MRCPSGLGGLERLQGAPRGDHHRVMGVGRNLHPVEPVGVGDHRIAQGRAECHPQIRPDLAFARNARAIRQFGNCRTYTHDPDAPRPAGPHPPSKTTSPHPARAAAYAPDSLAPPEGSPRRHSDRAKQAGEPLTESRGSFEPGHHVLDARNGLDLVGVQGLEILHQWTLRRTARNGETIHLASRQHGAACASPLLARCRP